MLKEKVYLIIIIFFYQCRSYQIGPEMYPDKDQGIGFGLFSLHGVSKLEILIHKKHIPESIPPIAGILLINNKDKVYGIFLNEKEYEIPAIKDLDSYINKYHFEKYPKFSIKKNFINFIGAYEIIVNNRNFMITCNNTLLLYNTSILEFEKKFPNLAAKYPFRNGTLFQEIIIKGELRYQKRGLPFFSI